jgi:hypothetical protein
MFLAESLQPSQSSYFGDLGPSTEVKFRCNLNCRDNVTAENFFKTLEYELGIPERYEIHMQDREKIVEFIEIWYYRNHLHSALFYQSPVRANQILNIN